MGEQDAAEASGEVIELLQDERELMIRADPRGRRIFFGNCDSGLPVRATIDAGSSPA